MLSDYDWLEECFLLEASLEGVPVPSHRAMLDRTGLIAKGKHREAVEPELPMGRWEIGDTALVAPAVGRVKITLDRPRRLVLEIEGEAPAYGVALYEDDAMLGAASPVANYTEAAVDILHAYAPEHEGAFWRCSPPPAPEGLAILGRARSRRAEQLFRPRAPRLLPATAGNRSASGTRLGAPGYVAGVRP